MRYGPLSTVHRRVMSGLPRPHPVAIKHNLAVESRRWVLATFQLTLATTPATALSLQARRGWVRAQGLSWGLATAMQPQLIARAWFRWVGFFQLLTVLIRGGASLLFITPTALRPLGAALGWAC